MSDDEKQKEAVQWSGSVLHGMVISIASQRYDGSYLDAHHSYWCKVTGCEYNWVARRQWNKFLVHKVKGNVVVLESWRFRNYYVDAHHSGYVKLTKKNNPPTGSLWAQWRIQGDDPSDVRISSVRYQIVLEAPNSKWAKVTGSGGATGIWGKWKIHIGKPGSDFGDQWEEVDSLTNQTSKSIGWEVKYKVGITKQNGWSEQQTIAVGVEAQQNFGAPGANFASASVKCSLNFQKQWSTTKSETWEESKETTLSMTVPPKKKWTVMQLVGQYGGTKIRADIRKIYEEEI